MMFQETCGLCLKISWEGLELEGFETRRAPRGSIFVTTSQNREGQGQVAIPQLAERRRHRGEFGVGGADLVLKQVGEPPRERGWNCWPGPTQRQQH
jgi:hypothetical protein